MYFALTTKTNTNGIVEFEYKHSSDYRPFLNGGYIDPSKVKLTYTVPTQAKLNRLYKNHLLESSGPELISSKLRETLENNQIEGLQYFNVDLLFKGKNLSGFFAINILKKRKCFNLAECEYSVMNFDPNNPLYTFEYFTISEDLTDSTLIQRSSESPRLIVVHQKISEICRENQLSGLCFSKKIDLTNKKRSETFCIK